MWEVRIEHAGLRASRVLKGPTQADAQWKATAQLLRWEQRWTAQQRSLAARHRLDRRQLTLHGTSIAAALTAEAAIYVADLAGLLAASLRTGPFFQWDHLKDTTPFIEPRIAPEPRRTPPPQLLKELYAADLTPADLLIPWRRSRKELEASQRYERDLAAWRSACAAWNLRSALDHSRRTEQREQNRHRHHAALQEQHAKVDRTSMDFHARDKDAVEYFFSELLSRSCWPAGFPDEATLQYVRSTKTLFVEYELPAFDVWPKYSHVRYSPARNALQEVPVAETWARTSYQTALYQIALRVLSELFAHDHPPALDRIALNGWVRSVDKGTGNMVHVRILSVVASRSAFTAINLAQVDPQACFRKLQGIVSRSPIDLLPVRSLMPCNHPSLDALVDLHDDGPLDLASMHRSDFETLVRETFEREFRKNRTQLRLTQAAHDANLDTLT